MTVQLASLEDTVNVELLDIVSVEWRNIQPRHILFHRLRNYVSGVTRHSLQ